MTNVVLAAVFYASFQLLAGFAAQKLSDLWFLTLGTISILFFTLLVVLSSVITGTQLGKLTLSGAVLIFLANGGITLFSLYLGRSFQQLDPKFVTPLVFGGAIFFSTIGGFLISRTIPSVAQIISLVLICTGLAMLAIQGK